MYLSLLLVGMATLAASEPAFVTGNNSAAERGVYEVRLVADGIAADPYTGPGVAVTFTRPDQSTVTVDAFYDGDEDGKSIFKARAYCAQTGPWTWTSASTRPGLDAQRGTFTVKPSALPGKLRKHPGDPRQFAYDNGDWFLHIGDTGYRYVVDTEPEWQPYIDQSAQMGATKIRTWFCRARSTVEALFTDDRSGLNLPYWQEIDRRVRYALEKHPRVILQLIPYAEDAAEVRRAGAGDPLALYVAQYAQARFSAFPNVTWCISNDLILGTDPDPGHRDAAPSDIDRLGREMAAREPWGTLLTNHQARYTGYSFVDAPWSDIVTIEDLDQIEGKLLLEYREKIDDPVILEEDRYELHETPDFRRYYCRRMMWASLLSGGGATYCGSRTYEPYNGREAGVRGYFDLNKEGILQGGADDFPHIHAFFKDTGLTLVGLRPADAMAQDGPAAAKVLANDRTVIAYLANPDAPEPGKAEAAKTRATCRLTLPEGDWTLRWFDPKTAAWHDGKPNDFTAPFEGDAVLLAQRK